MQRETATVGRQSPVATPSQHRGHLRLFWGMAPGVGKTHAMLIEAKEQLAAGKKVLLASLDTHGRSDIEKLAAPFARLPKKKTEQSPSWSATGLDLQAIEQLHPDIVLIDEMAVANPAGSAHAHRWQDIEELQAQGIDVWSTLNVQHLESLQQVIGRLVGFAVTETVPDRIFLQAAEVRFIDLPPDDLLMRLDTGKVFSPGMAQRAKQGYFRKSNLIALRELALRAMMDRMEQHAHGAERSSSLLRSPASPLHMMLLMETEDLDSVKRAADMAGALGLALHVVWLQTAHNLPGTNQSVVKLLEAAAGLGASTDILVNTSTRAMRTYCKQRHVSLLAVVGNSRWSVLRRELLLRCFVPEITMIFLSSAKDTECHEPLWNKSWQFFANRSNYTKACCVVGLLSLLLFPFHHVLEPTNCAMIYLLGVLLCGLNFGRAATALAAFLSVVIFDFSLVRPQWSLTVADSQYLITFAVMLIVGLVAGQLMVSRQQLSQTANERERQTRHLFDAARSFSQGVTVGDVFQILEQVVKNDFGMQCELWWPHREDGEKPQKNDEGHALLLPMGGTLKNSAGEVVYWCWDHQKQAGRGTATLPSQPYWYLPLIAGTKILGVLALSSPGGQPETDAIRRSVEALATLFAQALQRIESSQDVRRLMVMMESDKLRNTLLQSISHDLRTPVTLLKMVAEDLLTRIRSKPLESEQDRQLLEDAEQMAAGTTRMESMVVNLLELARLHSGQVQLHMSWIPTDELFSTAKSELGTRLQGFQLEMHLDSDCPTVYGDEVLLTRVLVNLLDNAVKYCPPKTRIVCTVQRQGHNISITVADNGPGLPPGDAQRLFAPFQRGKKESSVTGVGLGLAICQTIVQAHKGTITAGMSSMGGAAFTVTLPDVPLEELDDEEVILAKEGQEKKSESLNAAVDQNETLRKQ